MNETGSFPEESEKSPMCFMKCYLNAVGILDSENKADMEKTAMMYNIEEDEIVSCSNEICR